MNAKTTLAPALARLIRDGQWRLPIRLPRSHGVAQLWTPRCDCCRPGDAASIWDEIDRQYARMQLALDGEISGAKYLLVEGNADWPGVHATQAVPTPPRQSFRAAVSGDDGQARTSKAALQPLLTGGKRWASNAQRNPVADLREWLEIRAKVCRRPRGGRHCHLRPEAARAGWMALRPSRRRLCFRP